MYVTSPICVGWYVCMGEGHWREKMWKKCENLGWAEMVKEGWNECEKAEKKIYTYLSSFLCRIKYLAAEEKKKKEKWYYRKWYKGKRDEGETKQNITLWFERWKY